MAWHPVGMKEQPGAAQTQFVPVGAATLWTQTSGQGRPLVLCHGGPGMSDNLEPLARMVDGLVTAHRFDQRAGLEALRAHRGHRRWLVRLTEDEQAQLLAAEQRLADDGHDEDAPPPLRGCCG
jgi:hypothetical protein